MLCPSERFTNNRALPLYVFTPLITYIGSARLLVNALKHTQGRFYRL